MEDLIENFIIKLDNSHEIVNIKECFKKIKDNDKLLNKIREYKEGYNEELRKEILRYPELTNYYQAENKLNYLILEINKKLKELTNENN